MQCAVCSAVVDSPDDAYAVYECRRGHKLPCCTVGCVRAFEKQCQKAGEAVAKVQLKVDKGQIKKGTLKPADKDKIGQWSEAEKNRRILCPREDPTSNLNIKQCCSVLVLKKKAAADNKAKKDKKKSPCYVKEEVLPLVADDMLLVLHRDQEDEDDVVKPSIPKKQEPVKEAAPEVVVQSKAPKPVRQEPTDAEKQQLIEVVASTTGLVASQAEVLLVAADWDCYNAAQQFFDEKASQRPRPAARAPPAPAAEPPRQPTMKTFAPPARAQVVPSATAGAAAASKVDEHASQETQFQMLAESGEAKSKARVEERARKQFARLGRKACIRPFFPDAVTLPMCVSYAHGDHMEVQWVEEDADGWGYGRVVGTDREGYFPQPDVEDFSSPPWAHALGEVCMVTRQFTGPAEDETGEIYLDVNVGDRVHIVQELEEPYAWAMAELESSGPAAAEVQVGWVPAYLLESAK